MQDNKNTNFNYNNIAIKRKDGNNSDIVKVENGAKAKFYLEVQNAPPNTIKYVWNIDYLRKETLTNMVAVEMSNSFCGDIEVKVECITEIIGASSKISLIEGTELASQKKATTRKFKLQCPPLIRKVSFCFNHNEVPRIPNQDGIYELNHLAIAAFSIELEGYNGQEFEAYVVSSKGTFDLGKAIVNRNYVVFKNFILKYDEQDECDLLTFCYYNKNTGRKVESFKLQIFQHKLRNEEIEANSQVVVVGYPLQIADNNYHPCKFLDVEIREIEPNRNVIVDMVDTFKGMMDDVFGLDWHVLADHPYTNSAKYTELDYDIKDFVMIGNNKAKDVLVLVKDFTTSDDCCDNVPFHKKNVYVKTNSNSRVSYPIKNNEAHLSIQYPYGYQSPFLPFQYFFPLRRPIRKDILIESCRRTLSIPIIIYPDIQWFLGVKFKIIGEIKNKEKFKSLFSKDIGKNIKNDFKNSFAIGVIATWNGSEKSSIFVKPFEAGGIIKQEGVKGLWEHIRKDAFYNILLDTFRMFEDIISLMKLFELATSLAQPTEDFNFNEKRNKIVDLKFSLLPDTSLGVSWRAGAYNGKTGLIIEGVGKGSLLGLTAKFDLFCLISKMGPYGKGVILALDLIQWATDIKFEFSLTIEGKLKWNGKIGYDDSQNKNESKLAIGGLLEVTIKASVQIKPSENYKALTSSSKEYGARGVCGISGSYVMELIKNEEEFGVYAHLTSDFEDLFIEAYVKTIVNREGEEQDSDSNIISDENTQVVKNKILIKKFNIGNTPKKKII